MNQHSNNKVWRLLIWIFAKYWSEWQDLNLRPPRPERGALPENLMISV